MNAIELGKFAEKISRAIVDAADRQKKTKPGLMESEVAAALGLAIGALCRTSLVPQTFIESFETHLDSILVMVEEVEEDKICNCPDCVTKRTMENLFNG